MKESGSSQNTSMRAEVMPSFLGLSQPLFAGSYRNRLKTVSRIVMLLPRHMHEPGCGVNKMHLVPQAREPKSVRAGRSADIDHLCRRNGQETTDQFLRAPEFQLRGAYPEPGLFVGLGIEIDDFSKRFVVH